MISSAFPMLRWLRTTMLACLCVSGITVAQADAIPAVVRDALTRARLPTSSVSFFVQEVGASRPWVEAQADVLQNPASLMKLLTTYVALEQLGPAYTWRTTWWVDGTVQADVLEGDLYIKASGDPKFVWEHLWMALRELRNRGIRQWRGQLIVDRSVFAWLDHDEGRFDGDPLRAYNVGPDAWLLNFKVSTLRFMPMDQRLAIEIEPHPPGTALMADVRLVAGGCGDWRSRLKVDVSDPHRWFVRGDYPRECGPKAWPLSLFPADEYARQAVAQLWSELGGTLAPGFTVRAGSLSAQARMMFETRSPALADIVRDINKFSNNVMARQVFLSLAAAQEPQVAATAQRAEALVLDALARKGIDVKGIAIENGAGLSRTDRVTAGQLGRVLLSAWRSGVMPEFVSSLPVVGQDGTMRRRLTDPGLPGSAHIKTGSLQDVRGIAGYVLARSGKRYVVVSIAHHPNAGAAAPAHDALLEWIMVQG